MIKLLPGDCRDVLATLPAESVQCVVTSPPYYGLRDYGTALWDGGDVACDHTAKQPKRGNAEYTNGQGGSFSSNLQAWGDRDVSTVYRDTCGKCGAVRVDRQIGLEATPDEYLATMVAVFREVRRVLRRDGTCWVNVGDSFCSGTNAPRKPTTTEGADVPASWSTRSQPERTTGGGLAAKQLLLMPARLALALQAPQHYGPIAKETDRAWMAAFMDGEGTISIARNIASKSRGGVDYCQPSYTPFVTAGNQDVELVERLVQITGCGKVGLKDRPYIDARQIKSRRDYYGWRVDAKLATAIIRDIYPFLIAKRKQAILAYNLSLSNEQGRSLRGNGALPRSEQEKREHLKLLVNACNQRQPVDMPSWLIEPPSNFEQGWWVRADIIWHKPNPMPESCTDRPTSAHEHVFLLTRSARYYYDADAVREAHTEGTHSRGGMKDITDDLVKARAWNQLPPSEHPAGRNLRNVWTIATHAYSAAHFATFPPELAERCIKAGTSERGCCAACGKPWVRVTQGAFVPTQDPVNLKAGDKGLAAPGWNYPRGRIVATTTGWSPGCQCNAETMPCTVLDPFIGAGTTALVADRLQRDAIGIDLNTQYTRMAMDRCIADAPLLADLGPMPEHPEESAMADLFTDMAAD